MKKDQQATIKAISSYLPKRILSNKDLEGLVETTDEWIVSRTGIQERRIAAPEESTADMGAEAARKLLDKLGLDASQIDLILVATMTPDYLAPSTAALIQAQLQATQAAAMDLQAACSGFLYGLSTAKAFLESGLYKNVLLIASEKMSSFVDYKDRNTCVLFGDGASAVWLTCSGSGLVIDSVALGADGSLPFLAWVPAGGSKEPASAESIGEGRHFFKMEGKELFKHAVRKMASAADVCLKSNGLEKSAISWIIPHQANERILDAVARQFEIDPSRVYKTVHKFGNTSASSIPIALDELLETQPPSDGERLLLVAFGAGLTWGAALLRNVN